MQPNALPLTPKIAALPPTQSGASRQIRIAIGLSLSVLFVWAAFGRIPVADLAQVLFSARPTWIAAALVAVGIAYCLKVLRSTEILRALGARVGLREVAAPLLGSVALNNLLPLRAGDVLRVVTFRRFTGVDASGQSGGLILERLLDQIVLLLILCAAFAFRPIASLTPPVATLMMTIFAATVVISFILLFASATLIRCIAAVRVVFPWTGRVCNFAERTLQSMASFSNRRFLARMTILSLVIWLAEGFAYASVASALGISDALLAGLRALAVGTLATMIPSSPGYVGTFHFFVAGSLVAVGTEPALAAGFAVLIHALLWISTTSAGLVGIAVSKETAKRQSSSQLRARTS